MTPNHCILAQFLLECNEAKIKPASNKMTISNLQASLFVCQNLMAENRSIYKIEYIEEALGEEPKRYGERMPKVQNREKNKVKKLATNAEQELANPEQEPLLKYPQTPKKRQRQEARRQIKSEIYAYEKKQSRESLSNKILDMLKGVDFHEYVYAQCKSGVGRGSKIEDEEDEGTREKWVKEDELLAKEYLTLPDHWKINGQDVKTIGMLAGCGVNEQDTYYAIELSDFADQEGDTFEVEHLSMSKKTHITFTVNFDPADQSLKITNIDARKASETTTWAIEEAAEKKMR